MNFGSDNLYGASTPVLEALIAANDGALAGYGGDAITKRVEEQFCALFERRVRVFLVATGTAANALALSACVPPWGMTICHAESHINNDECGAPEFFGHGAKLAPLPGVGGKITADAAEAYIKGLSKASFQMPVHAVSLSQVTEAGTLYTLDEIAMFGAVCREHKLSLHMDGARFANALVALNTTPAEMTWKRGVDILSFGASKNGCLAAEAIVVFDEALATELEYRRKRSGHTLSKGRLLAAQFEGYLGNDLWLNNARHANAMTKMLATGLAALPGVRLPWPAEANELFPILPKQIDAALRDAGAFYYPWQSRSLPEGVHVGADEVMIRLVTSFATKQEEVEQFIGVAKAAAI